MTVARLTLAALAVVTLAACNKTPESQAQAPAAKEDVVATIDGQPLTRNTFEQYVAGVFSKPAKDISIAQRDQALDNLVRASVVAAEAERNGVAAKPEVAGTLAIQRLTILERAAAEEYLKDKAPSEEELRAEYDLTVAAMDKQEYRVSHIQVKTPEEAAKLIAELNKGARFEALVERDSMDANTRTKGGDLEWATPQAMPPMFAAAVKTLKKGQVAPTPVQSDFGFHVLKVTDVRETAAPPYESAKEQVVQSLQRKKFKTWTDGLMEKAKVTKTP